MTDDYIQRRLNWIDGDEQYQGLAKLTRGFVEAHDRARRAWGLDSCR